MNFFKHRHTAVAAIVAPLLAVLAYYGVDLFVGERPHAAREGEDYPLVERPGCRYAGGQCGLWNGDFELELSLVPLGTERVRMTLSASVPLEGVRVAVVTLAAGEQPPQAMAPAGTDGREWSLELARPEAGEDRVRLAASAAGALYFGEFSTIFMAQER